MLIQRVFFYWYRVLSKEELDRPTRYLNPALSLTSPGQQPLWPYDGSLAHALCSQFAHVGTSLGCQIITRSSLSAYQGSQNPIFFSISIFIIMIILSNTLSSFQQFCYLTLVISIFIINILSHFTFCKTRDIVGNICEQTTCLFVQRASQQ